MKVLGDIAWWLSMLAWSAALVAAGAAAISAFTRLPAIEATMPGIAGFFADDPAGAARFVAGYVTNPIFLVTDRVCLAAAGIAILSLFATRFRPGGPGPGGRIAAVAGIVAILVLGWYLIAIAPPLAEALADWRSAVFANDRAAATEAWSRFDPLHRLASRSLGVQFTALAVAIVASASASRGGGRPKEEGS